MSDFSARPLPANKNFNFLALIPAGEGTIHYTNRPDLRDWKDVTNRSTWGEPVAKFTRKAGLYQSIDAGASGTFYFTAQLVSSIPFVVNGKAFDFRICCRTE